MKLIRNIKQSIGLLLASLLLAASLVIGLVLSAMSLRAELDHQRFEFFKQSEDFIDLAVGGATSAAWAIDARLAREVVSGIISKAEVKSVEIRANLRSGVDQVLIHLANDQPSPGPFTAWIADTFFSDTSVLGRPLVIVDQGRQLEVGMLSVEFAPQYEAEKYVDSILSILMVSLTKSLLITLVLFLIMQWLVTSPLRRAAFAIAKINPEALTNKTYSVPVPDLHKADELGQLLHHINRLVERLAASQNNLHHLATRDPLTSLANRSLIQEQLSNMLANARRSSSYVAVIFMDLDRFKIVNDSLGHDIGDKLLKAVADRLLNEIREQDSIGRLGGDEFLVLAPTTNPEDITVFAERITIALDKPFFVGGYELHTNASLGIAVFPDDGDSTETLMGCADLAMYKAKNDNHCQWKLFSDDMKLEHIEEMVLETALVGAIDRGEMELFLQPQFYSKDNKLAACEALLRWNYRGDWIAPFDFIRIAESTGMIFQIGDWVISQTCQILKRWGDQAIPISVNVSGRQLGDENFVSRVFSTVQKYDINPNLIEFEITETMVMENLDMSIQRLSQLREAGFSVSIDDFGTGYSSLAYLTRLPIDELKIDRSFVSGSQRSTVVLHTIVALGRALKILVVAEGVETEQQRQSLIDSGCDLLQGYLLGKPMPVKEFESQFLMVAEKLLKNA